jgi:hypothetical protein
MNKEFVPYTEALPLKELGFDEPCFAWFILEGDGAKSTLVLEKCPKQDIGLCLAPTYQQAINFLYICSNKQIDIELKGSDTHEERVRKIEQGCKDLWNLQNNKSK